MPLDLAQLLAAAKASLQEPRQSARWILQMNLPLVSAVQALLVVAILNALMSYFVIQMARAAGEDVGFMALSPLNMAILQGLGMFLMAGGVHVLGRWFGGNDTLSGAIGVVAWMQFILLLMQMIQLLVTMALPFLAMPLAALVMAASLWLLVNFIAELHGFSSLIKVLAGIIGTVLAIIMVMTFFMSLLFI